MKYGGVLSRRAALRVGAVMCIGVIMLVVHAQSTPKVACDTLRYLPKITCYMDEVNRVMKHGGLEAGFTYARSMQEQLDYALNHFVMHEIGREAYHDLHGNVIAALELQKKHSNPEQFDYELDGYRHGLFEAFFADRGTTDSRLAAEICPDSIGVHRSKPVGVYAYPPAPIERVENDQDQCFHAVGHGIMYANNNDIKLSLSQCDKMPEDWQQQWCYYGAFMQYTYTDWPGYESELERHTKIPEGLTMTQLCDELPERQQNACARLAGRGYIDKETRNTKEHVQKVFDQCLAVKKQYQESCIVETAGSFMPEAFAKDPVQALSMCTDVLSDFKSQRACTYGVVSGYKQGAGKFAYKNMDNICDLVDAKFNDVCVRANGRGYTWF